MQKGKDAREVRDLDREIEELYNQLRPLGWRAAPALASTARDLKRPAKVRLFAVSFLALTADPAAFPPLSDVLLDREQDPGVRALAAQSLPGQGTPAAAVAKSLCAAIAQEDLPREVLSDALIPLSSLGCPKSDALARIARSFGPRPDAKDLPLVNAALAALGRSRGAASGRALLSLVAYYPALGAPRASSIAALDVRRADIAAWLAPEAMPVVVEALRSESGNVWTMLALIRLAVALGPGSGPSLERLASHSDAEVLAEAAEACVLFKRVGAVIPLEVVVANAMSDPRFSPKEGRPDPAMLLARIENSLKALKRAR